MKHIALFAYLFAYLFTLVGQPVRLSQLVAEETKQPSGARVAYMLLVNGAIHDAVVTAAKVEGHQSMSPPYVGTWHSFVKGMDQIQPGQPGHRTIANMYVTLLHLAGSSRDSFGMADPGLKDLNQHGPLEELLG